MKVATHNKLLTKLATSKWGANPSTIRTTALALSYSTAENAVPVWARSAHAKNLDPELNQACQSVTGCLKPTNVEDLYLRSGIGPPTIRRDVCARVERQKESTRETHSLFGQIPSTRRLNSRHCFLSSVQPANFPAKVIRCSEWRKRLRDKSHRDITNLHEELAKGYDSTWRCLNCLHIGYTCSKAQRKKVLHRRHHMCLWKSRRNHDTHVTVLPTRTSLLFGWPYYVQWCRKTMRRTMEKDGLMIRRWWWLVSLILLYSQDMHYWS